MGWFPCERGHDDCSTDTRNGACSRSDDAGLDRTPEPAEHGPDPLPGSGDGWDGADRCTWREHRACQSDRIEHVAPCPYAPEPDAPRITFRPFDEQPAETRAVLAESAALDGTDLARVLAILDGWTHDAQRGNALASGDAATYSALIRSLAEARTIVERHILAHPEPAPALDILTRRPGTSWSYDHTRDRAEARRRALAYGCTVKGDDHPADDGACGGPLVVMDTPPSGDGESCGIGSYVGAVCVRHLPLVASRISQSTGW